MAQRSERAVLAAILLAVGVFLLLRGRTAPERPPAPAPSAPRPATPADAGRTAESKPPADKVASNDTPPTAPASAPARAPEESLRIHGRTVDCKGAAVVGVEVELRAWSGKKGDETWTTVQGLSKNDGAFEIPIERRLATRGFALATTAAGYVEAVRVVKPEEYDESAGVELALDPARAIAGRILDEYGRPIPKSTVQLWYGSETTWPTEVDAEGRFRSPRHAPTAKFELIVEAPGHPIRTIAMPASEEDPTDAGDILFRRGLRVAGVAVDAAGDPVPDLPLILGGIAGAAPRTRTDGAGRFEFTDVGEGTVGVVVDGQSGPGGPPGARREYRGGISGVVVGSVDVRVPVRTETRVKFRFVDAATGSPVDVVKAEYGLRAEGTPAPDRLGHGASGSGPLTSTILSVWAGRYDLSVRSPGFEDADLQGVEVPDRPEVEIEVPMRRKP